MQVNVAIVDDEKDLREAIAEYLTGMGLNAVPVAGAEELKALLDRQTIDVVVLDIAMPGQNGLAIARSLRAGGRRPGIIFASAAGTAIDRVVGLEIGADDYLVKPFELRELLARIRSILRRLPAEQTAASAEPVQPTARRVKVGRLSFDIDSRTLDSAEGGRIDLTAMEGDLLATFAERPRRVLSRSQLLELAHGRSSEESERSVDIRITRLRRKIEPDVDHPVLIRTVRGEGYVFDPDGTWS